MTELKALLKRLTIKTIIASIIEFFIFLFFYGIYSLWIFWGAFGAILGFWLISSDIRKMVYNIGFKKNKKIDKGYVFRYILYGIILFVSAIISDKSIVPTFVGLFNLKIIPFFEK